MKNFGNGNWLNEFNTEMAKNEKYNEIPDELLGDSYEALNKLYQKENKRSKFTAQRRKQAWQ